MTTLMSQIFIARLKFNIPGVIYLILIATCFEPQKLCFSVTNWAKSIINYNVKVFDSNVKSDFFVVVVNIRA